MTREMQNSGVEWISLIPKGWRRTYLLNGLMQPITDGPHETPKYVSNTNGVPFISVDSLNDSENVDLTNVKKYISETDYKKYNLKTNLQENDILFSKAATIGKTAVVKKERFMVWSPLAVIKCKKNILYYKYLYYVLSCDAYITSVSNSGTKNTQVNVGMRSLEKSYIPLPPLFEQKKIADFLDRKTKTIDSVIKKTEQTIELYNKYKQSTITEAVTKGLDRDVPMKDSSISWVGEVPDTWTVDILSKYISQVKNKNIGMLEKNLLSLSYGKIIKKDIKSNEGLLPASFEGYNIISPRDIVLRLTDLQNDHKSFRVGYSQYRGIITSAYTTIRPNNYISSKYLYYVLHTFDIAKGFYGMGAGVRQGLNYDGVKTLKIPIPTVEEQQAIADYLDDYLEKIDLLILKKRKLIKELKSYKQSLIYEVVTGKKCVI